MFLSLALYYGMIGLSVRLFKKTYYIWKQSINLSNHQLIKPAL